MNEKGKEWKGKGEDAFVLGWVWWVRRRVTCKDSLGARPWADCTESYLTFSSGKANLLANIEKIATMQLWGHAPPGNYGSCRCSEVHSGAF